ncbi:VOC family protein, partial [Enterococcus sp. LJL90]
MINHIEINVKDLKKSKKFYTFLLQELGCTLFQEWEKGFSLKLDGLYIVFVQT